jgi:L-threonylcarbamoyladenylate synthase
MMIINYKKKYHKQIINVCVKALKTGKVVAYPTDTCYGLAVDASNTRAIKRLYRIKQRPARFPIHVVVPSVAYAKTIAQWNQAAEKLTKKFWPRLRQGFGGQAGPLTLVLPLKTKNEGLRILSAGTGTIGLRMPNNKIALDLAKYLKKPITTTSANPPDRLGGHDSFSAEDIIGQFRKFKYKPDVLISAGRLPRRKPSTIVKVNPSGKIAILRKGPVAEAEINKVLGISF